MTSKRNVISFLIVLTVAAVLLSAVPNWSTIGAEEKGDKVKGPVGSWYALGLSDSITFHADGALTGSSGLIQVDGTTYSISAAHGTWVRTGKYSTQNVTFCKLQTLDNTQWRLWRIRATNEFDENFEQAITNLYIDEWVCPWTYGCPDPRTEEPDSVAYLPGLGPAFRVTVE